MELDIIRFIQSFNNVYLDNIAQGITMLGEGQFYVILFTIIFWNINKKYGYKLGFILISNTVINGCVKDIVKAKRPIGEEGVRSLRVKTATGTSFPSGHTQGATAFWYALMNEFKRKWLYFLGVILIILIGLSRLYLGVHWPKDVAGGIVIGIAWVYVAGKIFDYSIEKDNKLILFVIAILSLVGISIFTSNDYLKSVAMMTGFCIGYFIEDKYINFKEKAPYLIQVLKFCIGLAGVLFIMVYLRKLLPKGSISDFIRYSLVGVWITAGAPFVFTKLFIVSRKEE